MSAIRQNIINTTPNNNGIKGFSLLELIMVMTVLIIMTGVAFMFTPAHQELLRADEEAKTISDMFQEARQRSLTQRETIRVEVDITADVVRLINENKTEDTADDSLVRKRRCPAAL